MPRQVSLAWESVRVPQTRLTPVELQPPSGLFKLIMFNHVSHCSRSRLNLAPGSPMQGPERTVSGATSSPDSLVPGRFHITGWTGDSMNDTEQALQKRQRASRKGQPRRFQCSHDGCEKRYSRAEHLARHQLNHNPKQIYQCEVEGCNHSFVRPDLYARHRKKHEESTLSEQGALDSSLPSRVTNGQDFASRPEESTASEDQQTFGSLSTLQNAAHAHSPNALEPESMAISRWQDEDVHQLLTPSSAVVQNVHRTATQLNDSRISMPTAEEQHSSWLSSTDPSNPVNDQSNDNFASWLFASPGSHNSGFDFNSIPFVDFGIEFGSNGIWSFDEYSTEMSNLGNRTYSTASMASDPKDFDFVGKSPHVGVSEERRDAIVALLSTFMARNWPRPDAFAQSSSITFNTESGDWPNLTTAVLESCTSAFWQQVSFHMPIVHQPTFSANGCRPCLLLAIIALGAAALVRSRSKGVLADYRVFADFVVTNLRWELFTHDDAQPPVHLWVAQTLLLLEHYEKMYSTRQLHERAHIHHASTLTLLRRGSPMIGRSGSESPPSETPTRATTPAPDIGRVMDQTNRDTGSWWKRWVSNESMNRVVFAAFQMDTLHACMFGHSADILPHELRLPLPCDDSLWAAKNAEEVRRLESTLSMYGIKPVNFLDGLKRCLHGYEVQTHHFARMILMAGLLSVGWHVNRREKNLQFVETVPSVQEQARWRSLLLQAFEHWRRSLNEVLNHSTAPSARTPAPDTSYPTVMFHLAHLTMHVDIIDCQILSGSRRLLGRKVSEKDRASVIQRMKVWASTSLASHASSHAFKVLQATLCSPTKTQGSTPSNQCLTTYSAYSCRNDHLIYRPWILYLAGLTIWAYQYASRVASTTRLQQENVPAQKLSATMACQYISACAAIDNADRNTLLASTEGCVAVLEILSQDFANAESELLLEASKRLQEGIRMLYETG